MTRLELAFAEAAKLLLPEQEALTEWTLEELALFRPHFSSRAWPPSSWARIS
jgi:hypothetical protein